jgi:hypothetical protein
VNQIGLHSVVSLLPMDIEIDPNSNGLPGIGQLRGIVGAHPLLRTDLGLPWRRGPTRRMPRPRPAVDLRRLRQRTRSDAVGRPGAIG